MVDSQALPPKPEVALALLQSAASVYVHLDPRPLGVRVPVHFKKQPQLVLQIGLNMAVPIVDLDVGQEALSCTLSFNRRPEFCRIPWSAVFGLVDPEGRGMLWPDSIPPEVASASEGRSVKAEAKKAPVQKRRDPKEEASDASGATPTAKPEKKRREKAAASASKEAPRARLRSVPGADSSSSGTQSAENPSVGEIGTSRSEPQGSPEQAKKPARPSHLRLVK